MFADIDFFCGLLEHYDEHQGITHSGNPSAAYEKKISALLDSEDTVTFAQLVCVSSELRFSFNGDSGKYFVDINSLTKIGKKK